jgi:Tfp pilus assembly protein PilF
VPAAQVFYNACMRLSIHCGIAACICAAFVANIAFAETRWIRVSSPNFEIYSSAGQGSTRDALEQFEQVRAFFTDSLPKADQKSLPVRIVAFRSEKEFEPYRFNEVASAYYFQGSERDTIVMSHIGRDAFPTAIHEYVHLLVRHEGLKLPLWLNEGLAEFYSTLRPLGGKILVGSLIEGRMYELQREKWVPLAIILSADRNSAYYNEKNKAGSLYDESWALTHMLVLTKEYRPRFSKFMQAVEHGEDSVSALTATYGKPLGDIEKDLKSYLHGDRFNGVLFDKKLQKVEVNEKPEIPSDFDVQLALLDLTNRPGKEKETQQELEKLMAQEPSRPEPYVEMGYLDWREGRSGDAEQQFAKAFSLGDRSPRMLWDFGRMAEARDPANASLALQEVVNAQPTRVDARIELAAAELSANRAASALGTLMDVHSVTPEEAPRLFTISALVYMKLGAREQARAAAERLAAVAQNPTDKDRAQQLLANLNRTAAPRSGATVATPASAADSAYPGAAIEPPEHPKVEVMPQPPTVSGTFAEFVCGGTLKIVVNAPTGMKTFVIQDPEKITVAGKPGGKVDLTCGKQKPVKIRVEYDPTVAGPGVDGAVRVIYFE